MKHDSPSFGETVGFDLDDGTDHREGHARFRSWTRFSWETSVFNGSLSDDFSPIGSKSGAKGWVQCPRRVSVVRYGRRVRVPAGLSYELVDRGGREPKRTHWALGVREHIPSIESPSTGTCIRANVPTPMGMG